MAVEIFAALQGFKAVLDSLEALRDIRDETLRSNAQIDVVRQLIELQGKMMATLQENATLTEQVRSLEAEVAGLKEGASDLQRYELKAIGGGAVAYMLKPAERGTEPPHWLCPSCYAQRKKSVLNLAGRVAGKTFFRCATCKTNTETRAVPHWD